MADSGVSAWWRDTARSPRVSLGFGSIDARVMYPLILWFFWPRWWTAAVVGVVALVLAVVEIWRMPPPAAIRAFFLWVVTGGFRAGRVSGGVVAGSMRRGFS